MIMVYTKLRKIISRKLLLLNSSKNQILHSNIKTKPSGIAALLYCQYPCKLFNPRYHFHISGNP